MVETVIEAAFDFKLSTIDLNYISFFSGLSSIVNGNQTSWDSSGSNMSERTQSPEPLIPPTTIAGIPHFSLFFFIFILYYWM